MTMLEEIEGIGPAYAVKLEAAGIASVEELLERGGHTAQREELAAKTGLDYDRILEWVNRADLMRIKGIGSEFSDLLEFAGVDTVPELAQRNAANLTAAMAKTDGKTDLVRRLPKEEEVADWITQAKALPRMVWYEARSRAGAGKAALTDLLEIEGVGPAYKEKLVAVGIDSVEELLEKGAHTKDREEIAAQSGLTYEQILEWVNRADLMRIKGIGSEYADLLEFAGVDTVMELAQRNPANLSAKMGDTDRKTDLVRRLPTEAEVTEWIAQAKALPRKVWYEARSRKLAGEAAVFAGGAAPVVEAIPPGAITATPVVAPQIAVPPAGVTPVAAAAITEEPVVAPPVVEPRPVTESVTPLVAATAAAPLVTEAIKAAVSEKGEEKPIPVVPLQTPTAPPVVTPPAQAKPISPPPIAQRPVGPVAATSEPDQGAMAWLWPVLGLAGVGLLIWLVANQKPTATTPSPTPAAVALASPVAANPVASAPVAAAPAANEVRMLYDGGAETWILPAAEEFNKQTKTEFKIVPTKMGSREGRDHILYDKDKVHPTLWNPGDMYWTDKLKADSADASIPSKSGATADEVRPLLQTYFVLLMPDAKAKAFEAAMAKPEYKGKTWTLLHDLATKGWSAAGAPADWGKLKLAQADPTKANSGMTALVLMYQEWAKANPGKTINDKGFLKFMAETQSAVTTFAPSTSDLMKEFVAAPDKADMALAYESEAIRAMNDGTTGMKVVYPSPTVVLTLPVALVKAGWVPEDHAKLGKEFADFLTSDAIQEKALTAGYRPVSAALSGKTKEVLGAKSAMGVIVEPPVAKDVDTKTKEGLIFNWNEWFKKKGG